MGLLKRSNILPQDITAFKETYNILHLCIRGHFHLRVGLQVNPSHLLLIQQLSRFMSTACLGMKCDLCLRRPLLRIRS